MYSAVLAMAVLVASGRAATVYSDRTTWESVVSGLTTINFEGIAAAGATAQFDTSAGLTVSGVQFLGQGTLRGPFGPVLTVYNLDVTNDGTNSVVIGPSSGRNMIGGSLISQGTGRLIIIFPSPVTAFGANVQQSATPLGSISVGIPSQSFDQSLGAVASPLFWGIISPVPFTGVVFAPGIAEPNISKNVVLDDVSFGNAVVPEPSSALMLIAGAGVIALVRYRRGPVSNTGSATR